uniref:Calcium-dependent protein kinase n=1 Tax=Chlamydomonas leiostraca TaxID=1034604 RepID=A0A7S0WKH2_9CHLO|mmetsp:Transcript_16737/g.41879  ORF Transcript_16737/g.41879 Transcript_16737/m.41879 type:complete len:597 (+) Transcript_16737:115-1905(+)|eukprot:CAMPEP_0202865426 /NCGR_PEP_ID=MMETSP1391-20130828/5978_1 /ASSEMBLY_ACC=CAM_ASM_000867 /TAXON_ID=1034604 /ORGANISM="Chlamydomonas leiostraca, Strain SAG 11-49" /LENGTH=596 /DNA_ID=CAMNT_0049545269 /DNA_START=95 /DNA_END=1885 /DNA_ORIENTATION=+
MAKEGNLEVTLSHAQDLKDVEIVGRQDPYCVLTIGQRNFRSKTDTDGGKHPVWNETFSFTNVSAEQVLKLEFFDENMILRDVAIGGCKVALTEVMNAGSQEVCVPVVTRKGKHRGDVFLKLVFKPNSKQMRDANQTPAKPGNWILPTYGNTDCWKDYEPGTILGKGTFGTTYLATKKGTSEKYAVKVISKRKLSTPEEIDDVKREVQIMHHLAGHANVVHLKGVYEDKSNVCLVMEVCTGGELFDSIVKRGHYTEKDAATLIRTIVGVVAHCHNMGVIHRDLKPENFLLSDKTATAQLKATDFGLSSFFQEGQIFTDIVGSAYYVAPEVLRRAYSKEADIWSCGVILYILLCGFPPFHGDNEKKIFEAVISKTVDFTSEPWPRISEPAKDCVRRMLVRDPKRRATANEILKHDWMRENGVASDNPLEMEVLTRIKNFTGMNKLKKEALKVIAVSLPVDEISGMRELFLEIDKDKSGTITVEEFGLALRKKGQLLPEADIKRILEDADVNGDGTIDYEEFLAATINLGKLEREDHLKKAFEHFDLDGNGEITRDELQQALANLGIKDDHIQEIIVEVDKDGSGTIDYNEFCIMMRNM